MKGNTVGAVVPTAPAFRLADSYRRSGFSPCPEVMRRKGSTIFRFEVRFPIKTQTKKVRFPKTYSSYTVESHSAVFAFVVLAFSTCYNATHYK